MKLLKLGKPGCLPCVQLSGFLDELGVNYEDINMLNEPDYAVKYNVMSNPVLILLDDEGKEVERVLGFNLENTDKFGSLLTKFKGVIE